MNVKEHIVAGHYERDSSGRPRVPMKGGGFATIVWTNCPYGIWGVPENGTAPSVWRDDGENWGPYHNCRTAEMRAFDLLPPPPRKVTYWGVIGKPSNCPYRLYATKENAEAGQRAHCGEAVSRVIELTGEYEEPWPELSETEGNA